MDLELVKLNKTSKRIRIDLRDARSATLDGLTGIGVPTTVSAPTSAPTIAVTGGGSTGGLLAAGAYFAKYTISGGGGETTPATESSTFTVAAGNIPTLTFPPGAPTTGQTYNVYLTAAGGATNTEVLYLSGITSSTINLSIAAPTSAVTPPGANTALTNGLKVSYFRDGDTSATAITLVAASVGTWTTSGWVAADASLMPGEYELGTPNAMWTTLGAVQLIFRGAANQVVAVKEFQVVAFDPEKGELGILGQQVAFSNTANSIGDCMNAARAQGFGKWVLSGTTLTLYASDGTTAVRTFTLDSATAPLSRT